MGDTDLETMANVTIAEYDYEDEAFDNVSKEAKDFIDRLLVKEQPWVFVTDICDLSKYLMWRLISGNAQTQRSA